MVRIGKINHNVSGKDSVLEILMALLVGPLT